MGETGTPLTDKRQEASQIGSQSPGTAVQQKSVPDAGVRQRWCHHSRRHWRGPCDSRSEAGPHRLPAPQQDLLLLLAHNQGPRSEHALARCHSGQGDWLSGANVSQ